MPRGVWRGSAKCAKSNSVRRRTYMSGWAPWESRLWGPSSRSPYTYPSGDKTICAQECQHELYKKSSFLTKGLGRNTTLIRCCPEAALLSPSKVSSEMCAIAWCNGQETGASKKRKPRIRFRYRHQTLMDEGGGLKAAIPTFNQNLPIQTLVISKDMQDA